MIIHREIGSSYYHKPQVQGVDYSPLMVESDEEALVKEERRQEATPTAVPPPIFRQRRTADSLFRGFRSPPPPVMRSRLGHFLLMVLGQDEEIDAKTDGIGATRAK